MSHDGPNHPPADADDTHDERATAGAISRALDGDADGGPAAPAVADALAARDLLRATAPAPELPSAVHAAGHPLLATG